MKLIKNLNTIGIALFLLFIAISCDKNAHEGEVIIPAGNGALNVELQTEGTDIPVRTVHLFIFGANDKLQAHEYFDNPAEAGLHATNLPSGHYTVIVIANVPADFMPPATRADLPDISLADFNSWLSEEAEQYPEILTGMAQTELTADEVMQLSITVKEGTEGITLPVLHLSFSLPQPQLTDYTPAAQQTRAAEAGYILRCVAEVCFAGTDEVAFHCPLTPTLATDGSGKYLLDLTLNEKKYDLRLWVDYAPTDSPKADTYYHTDNLKTVTINNAPYMANTDAKDVAYHTQTAISLPKAGAEIDIQLQRPLAKYRLIATDVEEYHKLRESNPNDYPPLDDLTVTVQYEGFFPSSFNVATGKPSDAIGGVGYSQALPSVSAADKEVQMGSDWILVNGTESFVLVTITVADKQGDTICRIPGVQIDYRRGLLTTVNGKFLTAGKVSGGVNINTGWGGENIIEF